MKKLLKLFAVFVLMSLVLSMSVFAFLQETSAHSGDQNDGVEQPSAEEEPSEHDYYGGGNQKFSQNENYSFGDVRNFFGDPEE